MTSSASVCDRDDSDARFVLPQFVCFDLKIDDRDELTHARDNVDLTAIEHFCSGSSARIVESMTEPTLLTGSRISLTAWYAWLDSNILASCESMRFGCRRILSVHEMNLAAATKSSQKPGDRGREMIRIPLPHTTQPRNSHNAF
jgi:hypothetical protein